MSQPGPSKPGPRTVSIAEQRTVSRCEDVSRELQAGKREGESDADAIERPLAARSEYAGHCVSDGL